MATISLRGILLVRGVLELAEAPANPRPRHIDAAHGRSVYRRLSNPFCVCPGQQATACSAGPTRMEEAAADHGKHRSCLDGRHYKGSEA